MAAIVLILTWACATGIITSSSRMTWAFARDRGTPFSRIRSHRRRGRPYRPKDDENHVQARIQIVENAQQAWNMPGAPDELRWRKCDPSLFVAGVSDRSNRCFFLGDFFGRSIILSNDARTSRTLNRTLNILSVNHRSIWQNIARLQSMIQQQTRGNQVTAIKSSDR